MPDPFAPKKRFTPSCGRSVAAYAMVKEVVVVVPVFVSPTDVPAYSRIVGVGVDVAVSVLDEPERKAIYQVRGLVVSHIHIYHL